MVLLFVVTQIHGFNKKLGHERRRVLAKIMELGERVKHK